MKSQNFILAITIAVVTGLSIPTALVAQDATTSVKRAQHHHYKLIDVGTFGGPGNSVIGGTEVVSDRGRLVGQADTSLPDPYYPNSCVICFDPFIFHAFQWQNGVLTDLASLAADSSSVAFWTSNSGLSVGFSETGAIDPLLGKPEIHAVLWKNGHITDLGTLGGGYESFATGVNSRGQVVGVSSNLVSDPFGPLGTQNRAFLWQNGVMQDLGTLGGPDAGPLGPEGYVQINERGQIIACSYTNWTANPVTNTPTLDPFLWESGQMLDLGTLGGTSGCAIFLNNRGHVVGYSNLMGDLTFHPFLWQNGKLSDLGTLGGPTGSANWINERDEVIGNSDLPGAPGCNSPNISHGFLWKNGSMTDIGTLAGTDCSFAASINSKTQVAGASFTKDFSVVNAILWENDSLVDLNMLVPPDSTLHLLQGVDINDRGEIAGFGFLPNGDGRTFLLIPCDDNHPGVEGCDYSMVEAADVANNAAARQSPRAILPTVDSITGTINPSQNWFRQHYPMLGQRPPLRQ